MIIDLYQSLLCVRKHIYIIIIYKKTLHLIKNQQKQPITLVIPYLRLTTRISFFLSYFAHIATTDANLAATAF